MKNARLRRCAASAVVTEPASFERFCALQQSHPGLRTIFLPASLPEHEYPGAVLIDEEQDCCLHVCTQTAVSNEDDLMWLFTSGTTSRPKAVQLTHANAVFAGMFGAAWLKVAPQDRHMLVLPLFHVNVKRAGENVAACEVEYVISLHPAVQEVAVVGVSDAMREEAVLAFVIARPGECCSEKEIIDWCSGKLADFKVPGSVRFIEDFPRTSLGKVQKNILKQQALKETQAEV